MKHFVTRHALLLFFILAFAIAWLGILFSFGRGGVHVFHGENVLEGDFSRQLIVIWLIMIAAPAFSGILLTAIIGGRQGLRDLLRRSALWKVPVKWYGYALLIFPTILFLIFSGFSFVSDKFSPASLVLPGVFAGLIGGFFEELGWTGFALPRFLSRFGFLKTGLLFGVIHTCWHFLADYLGSIDLYKGLYLLHFLLWMIALVALRFVILWLYQHTGSVLLAALAHASSTGSQIILTPASLTGEQTISWYSLFAAALLVWTLLIIRSEMKKTTTKKQTATST